MFGVQGRKNILLPLFVSTLGFINASPVIDVCGEWMASKQIVASMLVLPRKNANLQRSTTAISRPSQSSARPLQGTIAVNMSRKFQRKNVRKNGIKMVKDWQPKGLMRTSHLFPFRLFNIFLFLTLYNKIFRSSYPPGVITCVAFSAYRKPAFQPSALRRLFIAFQPSAENQPPWKKFKYGINYMNW